MTAIDRAIAAASSLPRMPINCNSVAPVTHVYNPLTYAWRAHKRYLEMMNPEGAEVLFLGMNPGPWGMARPACRSAMCPR